MDYCRIFAQGGMESPLTAWSCQAEPGHINYAIVYSLLSAWNTCHPMRIAVLPYIVLFIQTISNTEWEMMLISPLHHTQEGTCETSILCMMPSLRKCSPFSEGKNYANKPMACIVLTMEDLQYTFPYVTFMLERMGQNLFIATFITSIDDVPLRYLR